MFHFWFNTFFVAADHDEHTMTMKSPSDGRSRTPHSSAATLSSVKLQSTAPSTKPVHTAGSSGRRQSGDHLLERKDFRTADRVLKPLAVRTSSGTSSASSGTCTTVSVRRPSQQRDRVSVRPRSVHVGYPLSGAEIESNLSSSTSSLNTSLPSKMLRDKLKASFGSAGTTHYPKPLHHQEPSNSPRTVAAQTKGRSETPTQEEQKKLGGESSVSLARQGNPRNVRGVGSHRSVARSDSARVSRTKEDTPVKTPEHNGIVHPSTGNGGRRKLSKENAVIGQSIEPPAETGHMKKASSTTALNKTGKKDSATGHYVQHANTSAKPSSGVPRFIQNYSASRRMVEPNKSEIVHHTSVSKQASNHALSKSGVSGSRLVSSVVQARGERLPSDPVSLTRYTPRTPRQNRSAAQPSSGVLDVSGASSLPTTFFTLTLPKSEIDKANKDVQQKVYSSDFKVRGRLLHAFRSVRQK